MTSAWGREALEGEGVEEGLGVAAGGGGEEVAVDESLLTPGDFLGGAVVLLFIEFSNSW